MKKITKNISQIITGASAALCLWTGKAISVYAAEAPKTPVEQGAEAARAKGMPAELIGDNGVFGRITNVVLLAVGIISVVMLIYGGLRYILYAIIGLIISLLAYAIVNFVLNSVIGVNYIQGA